MFDQSIYCNFHFIQTLISNYLIKLSGIETAYTANATLTKNSTIEETKLQKALNFPNLPDYKTSTAKFVDKLN